MNKLLSFINYPAVRFKRSHLTREFLYKFFITDENEREVWKSKIFDAMSAGDAAKANELLDGAKVSFSDYMLIQQISALTYDDYNLEQVKKQLESITGNKYLKSFSIDDDQIFVDTAIGPISAVRLTSAFPEFKNILPKIGTRERLGKCHTYANKIALKWFTNFPYRIATGYINPFTNRDRILHSWIEFKDDGQEYVIDASRNLLMNKSGYYQLLNVTGSVYKITPQTVRREQPILKYLAKRDAGYSKLYLANRHQAIAVYKKLRKEEEEENELDPLYQAAKTMSEGFKKREKQRQKGKKSKPQQNGQ